MPPTRRSGPRHRGRPDTNTRGQGNADASVLPTVRALILPATGRRRMDAAVVLRCEFCRRSHLHRGYRLNGAVRESGCWPKREYVLAVAA